MLLLLCGTSEGLVLIMAAATAFLRAAGRAVKSKDAAGMTNAKPELYLRLGQLMLTAVQTLI